MFSNLATLIRYRGLVQSLVARELKARYRGSVLGFLWSFINPLLLLSIYTFVFTVVLPNRNPIAQPYAVFMFCGILPWNWFSSSLMEASGSLVSGGDRLERAVLESHLGRYRLAAGDVAGATAALRHAAETAPRDPSVARARILALLAQERMIAGAFSESFGMIAPYWSGPPGCSNCETTERASASSSFWLRLSDSPAASLACFARSLSLEASSCSSARVRLANAVEHPRLRCATMVSARRY